MLSNKLLLLDIREWIKSHIVCPTFICIVGINKFEIGLEYLEFEKLELVVVGESGCS